MAMNAWLRGNPNTSYPIPRLSGLGIYQMTDAEYDCIMTGNRCNEWGFPAGSSEHEGGAGTPGVNEHTGQPIMTYTTGSVGGFPILTIVGVGLVAMVLIAAASRR